MISLYLYLTVLLLCVLVGLYYRHALVGHYRYVLWLVVITLVLVEAVGYYYLTVFGRVATWIFHLYQPVEYALLALYFYGIIKQPVVKKAILVSMPIVLVANILNATIGQGLGKLSTYTFLFSAFLFCVWAIMYFRQLLSTEIDIVIWENPNFWICIGVLFFYGGVFFQMGLTNYLIQTDRPMAEFLYKLINHLLNVVMYGLFTYGFICQAKYRNTQLL
jgi:hypothetical protein